jgi:membrane-associated phospholipid phosphatase
MVARADTVLYNSGHRKWYIASLVLLVIVFVWAALEVHHHILVGWEQRYLLDINHWPNHWRMYAVVLSTVGGSVWTAVIAVVLGYILKLYRLTWRLAVSFLLATVLVYAARHLVAQQDIFHVLPSLHARVATSGMDFPSGAATVATVIALSMLPYLDTSWRVLLPLWIIVVGLAQLYLGAQTPLDLIAGLVLGIFLVSLIRVMPQAVRVALRLD